MAIVCMAVTLGWLPLFCRGAQAESRQAVLDFALKRASLELAAGRPHAAARVLRAMHPQPQASAREGLAFLLLAESEILSGNESVAWELLAQLRTIDDGFLRGQGVAHELGLQLLGFGDGDAAKHTWQEAVAEMPGNYREDASWGYLLEATLSIARGDSQSARLAWEEARDGPSRSMAELLLAESALQHGDARGAEAYYTRLAKRKEDIFAGWLHDWAVIGRARALAPLGRRQEALAVLETVRETEHLQQYAWLFSAQLLHESQRYAEALEFLGRLQLQRWNPSLAAEAQLLTAQIHLHENNLAAAEDVASQLQEQLDVWFAGDNAAHVLERQVQLDVTAWHAARTRQTIQCLADKGILRDQPAQMQLSESAAIVLLVPSLAMDSLRTRVTLLAPYPHERHEGFLELAERVAAQAQGLGRNLRYEEGRLQELQRNLDERRFLMQKALQELAAHASMLQQLQGRSAHAERHLQQYEEAWARQDSAWAAVLEGRLRAWRATLDEVQQAQNRLRARYPQDRLLRRNPAVDTSRQVLIVADEWLASMDSLQVAWQSAIRQRVRQVLRDFEPASAARQVAALQLELDALQRRTQNLAGRFGVLDGFENRALAEARALYDALVLEHAEAQERLFTTIELVRHDATLRAQARENVYRQAARDANVTAIFLAATDAGAPYALERWQRATQSLQAFVAAYPHGVRADEMWYRLGEAHLQQAALQYKADLADFLGSGGDEQDAPVPVQNYAEALDAYEQVLRRFPESARVPEAHFQSGFLLAEMGSPEASSDHLESFLALTSAEDLRRGSAALRIGDNHLLVGQREAACQAFARAADAADRQASDLGLFKLGWSHYDLERPEEARQALFRLLHRAASDDGSSHARDLQPEALELMSLAFAEDHEVFEAAEVMQAWGAPEWQFVVKRRMAQLFASRALFDQAIHGYQHLYQEHPNDPRIAGVAEEWMRLVELRGGSEAAHELAADLAVHFAPHSEWSQNATNPDALFDIAPAWQSRLLEEDQQAARVDSLSRVLADADAAAQRMAAHLRAAGVFAHRRAQADSSQAQTLLRQAALRYEMVLQQFPGSQQEAQTWLYLAEARAGLGDALSAADAYAQAAAHEQADSVVVAQAALGELVVLDAAAERQPQLALQRFDASVRQYLTRASGDANGLNALERVGELSFVAEDWSRAEAAYIDFAAATADRRRAARALKYAGDTWWQRHDALRAAQQYEVARHAAAAAGEESLSAVLDALIPGALYQAASLRREKSADEAIVLFERVAQEYNAYEYAPQALYAAAQLRDASGDAAGAEHNYALLVRAYPQHELRTDALLESAALAEKQGHHADAAAHLEHLLETQPAYAERHAAHLRIADLYLQAEQPKQADRHYAQILEEIHASGEAPRDSALAADLWMRRARLAADSKAQAQHYARALECGPKLSADDWAEARFFVTETHRPHYQTVRLSQPIDKSLEEKKQALEILLTGYGATLERGVHPWHAAASLRLGESLAELAGALRDSEPPAALTGEDLWGWQEAMNLQAQNLEDRAVASWSLGLRGARDAQQEDAWTVDLREQLYPMLSQRIPTRPAPMYVLVTPQER